MQESTTARRVAPKPWVGFAVVATYLTVVYGIWAATGLDYERLGESADTVLRWLVVPFAAGALIVGGAVTWFGWWQPTFVETRRLPRWVWVVPSAVVLLIILGLTMGNLSQVTPAMWVSIVIGCLLVGFTEETATRGQLLVALRARFNERTVWLLSCLTFGALHLPNAFFGEGAGAVIQFFMTFMLGSALYLTRRVTGSLVPAIGLHAAYDVVGLTSDSTFYSGLLLPVLIAAVIIPLVILRKETRAAVTAVA